jgi:hypothetical protein
MNMLNGDWGLGIGDWPNPQSPIPNPQSPLKFLKIFIFENYLKIKFS